MHGSCDSKMASMESSVLRNFDSGDNWETYSEQLEQYFTANSIPDKKRAVILLTVVSPPIYEILKDSCHPELPQLKTYADLTKLLKTHYSHQTSVFEQRIKFHEAKQADNESVNKWFSRITGLAVFCEFGKHLDTMLRDKFISGLADQKIVGRLCKENEKAMLTMRHMVDMAVKMNNGTLEKQNEEKSSTTKQQRQPEKIRCISSRVTNLLDISNEILIKIILLLNARERVPLGNSCRRFNHLVFEDEAALRALDFSREGRLTTMSDIEQYFHKENTSKHIRKVNIRNVKCMKPPMLHDSIGKAINLVDINIEGTAFQNIWQLGCFLHPLQHVRRLSISWKIEKQYELALCKKILQRPFSRLTYLSVTLQFHLMKRFFPFLKLCQELKELRIVGAEVHTGNNPTFEELSSSESPVVLRNLQVVECCALWAMVAKRYFVTILPDPEKWADFQLDRYVERGFYLEKNVEVCTELVESMKMECSPDKTPRSYTNVGWAVVPEILLTEVLRITQRNVPKNFCCLSTFKTGGRCLLKINDAKKLLKNPKHEISYLFVDHIIARDCDLHLIASAFPNLTELILCYITLAEDPTSRRTNSERQLLRKGSALPQEQDDSLHLDSSFKILVENTPHLRHFTLDSYEGMERDLDMLYLISGWKSLRTLRLRNITFEYGDFLIEIGRQCTDLEELELHNLHSNDPGYDEVLLQMLSHCKNLRDFSINRGDWSNTYEIGQVSELFTTLANLKQLRRVCADLRSKNTMADLISSIEQLLHRCTKLSAFIFEVHMELRADGDALFAAARRWRGRLNRPNFQMRMICHWRNDRGNKTSKDMRTVYEDTPHPDPFPHVDNRLSFSHSTHLPIF